MILLTNSMNYNFWRGYKNENMAMLWCKKMLSDAARRSNQKCSTGHTRHTMMQQDASGRCKSFKPKIIQRSSAGHYLGFSAKKAKIAQCASTPYYDTTRCFRTLQDVQTKDDPKAIHRSFFRLHSSMQSRAILRWKKVLPDAARRFQMLQDASGRYKTLPDAARRFQTLQDASGRCKTLPDAARHSNQRCFKGHTKVIL